MVGGRVQKAEQNVTLTTNQIKRFMKIQLTPEEERVEEAYKRGRNGK
jgi:DNA sulfur modification protein DndB